MMSSSFSCALEGLASISSFQVRPSALAYGASGAASLVAFHPIGMRDHLVAARRVRIVRFRREP